MMKDKSLKLVLAALLLTLVSAPAFAQGGTTSSITGVVVDSGGGVIPGATVVAKSDTMTSSYMAVSGANGAFTIPSLPIGKYTVTVTLQGFKTQVLKDVTVTAAGPANISPKLEVGGVAETVTVEGATKMIQLQSAEASTTLNTNQILNLPVGSRNTLDFVQFLPGVQTQGSVRDSTVVGLPQSSISITVDGVNVQDNYLKTTDGFFARMSPRLDAVEEVSLTTAAQGADASGQGATQIKFTTRSGTNQYNTSLYHFYQSHKLNTNSFSNKLNGLPKGPLQLQQPGGRVGGPVVIPGLYDGRGKAFFFVNYEHFYQPSTITSTATLINADTEQGWYKYAGGPAQGVNVLALAAANGFVGTTDPVIAKLLADIRASTTKAVGVMEDTGSLNSMRFRFQQPGESNNKFPTYRIDYNLSAKHRLSFSQNRNYILSSPDTTNSVTRRWPGFPNWGEQHSVRYQLTGTMRSTLSGALINELRLGASGGPTEFSPRITADHFTGSLANQMGFALGISASGSTNAFVSSSISTREPTTRVFEDTLTWLKGSHSLSMGMSFTKLGIWVESSNAVPSANFGVLDSDPVISIFNNAANFPGSSSGNRNSARDLYATLVGSVTSINATARLNGSTGKYVYNGLSRQQGVLRQFDTFIQDNWRLRPNLSINVGLRFAIQPAFYSTTSSYSNATLDDVWGISGYVPGCQFDNPVGSCNIFMPGTVPGRKPSYVNQPANKAFYNTDMNNYAPSVGFNWTPALGENRMSKLLFGQQSDTSFSGGWTRAYERHGLSEFTGVLSGNPGLNLTANRNQANGNIPPGLLLRQGAAALGGPANCLTVNNATGCMLDAPTYPLFNTNANGTITTFDPDYQVPYSDTYTAAIQRQIGRKTAIEVRYLGSRNREQVRTNNYNEANIIENHFIDEFRLAQKNLQASIAAGCGGTLPACSFAYKGVGTNTSPLPIYAAFFSGVPASQAGDVSKYTSNLWTSSNFISPLGLYTTNVFTPAGTNANTGLAGDPTRQANSIAAGLPANFFRANPDMLGGARAQSNGGYSKYNSVQLQLRRRLSNGLQVDFNYTNGHGFLSNFYSFRVPRILTRDEGDVTHALKGTWVYELPYGRGKRFGTNTNRWVDGFLGGWIWSGTTRVQSGDLIDLGNVRVVGMSIKEAQEAFHLRKLSIVGAQGTTPAQVTVYAWPQDIIDNTIKAYSTSSTSPTGYSTTLGPPSGRYFAPAANPTCFETINSGYGDCGVRSLIVTGPPEFQMDWSLRKNVQLGGRRMFQVSVDVFNVLNFVQWSADVGLSNDIADYRSGIPGSRRTIQIGSRFTW
jgi:carboxypeptidase family protein